MAAASARRLIAVLLVSLGGALPAPTLAGKVYIGSFYDSTIYRMNLDGTDPEAVHVLTVGLPDHVDGIAIDVEQDGLFWTVSNSFGSPQTGIYRSDLDGNGAVKLISSPEPSGIAVDPGAGKVYWADFGQDRMLRADVDGTNVEELFIADGPANLALDPVGGKLYWTEHGPLRISRSDLDGTGAETIYIPPTGESVGPIALDLPSSKMYWIDHTAIRRANLDGTGVEVVLESNIKVPRGIALDPYGGKMYWVDNILNPQRANLDGSGVETISPKLSYAVALAIDGVCGDGTLGRFEECDDGNTVDGDGCQGECLLSECGDGILDAGEECDDDNETSCDGCSALCQIETGFLCGDGEINTDCGEQCDDGNTDSCDGCSALCEAEPGAECGDGMVNPGCEECDDGNTSDADGCQGDCRLPFCGDGIVDSPLGETCDDGNTDPDDGCANCDLTVVVPSAGTGASLLMAFVLAGLAAALHRSRREPR